MALTRITKGVIKPNENYDTHNINSTGIVTAIGLDVNGNGDISGNLSVGGVLTYEDVTSIDSVGIITARDGIDCNGDIDVDGHTNLDNVSIAGVTTTVGDVTVGSGGENSALGVRFNSAYAQIKLPDGQTGANRKGNLSFGDNDDFRIVHDGHHNYITAGAGDIYVSTSSANPVNIFNNKVNVNVDLNLIDTATDSAAGPEFKLFRNSASPADADYLGQIKFAGESDTGVERNYAKITGKILDASNGTEDGILEFAHIKGGSQTITGRWRSDSLQLLNSTNLTVDGDLDVDGHTNLDNVSIAGFTTISSTSNGEIFRIETSAGNPGGTQGLAYMGFDHFPASTKPAILIGCEEDGNASYKGNFVVKLKDAAATDDDPVQRFKIDSSGRVLIGRASAYGSADADNLIVGDEAVNEHQGITILSHSGKYGGIYFGDGAGSNPTERGKIIYDHPNDQLRMGTAGSAATKFYLNAAGEVGISVSPESGHLLHIKNAGSADSKVKIESESGNDARLILDTSNGGGAGAHIDFQIDGTAKGGIQYVTNGSASDQHDMIFRNNNYTENLRITSAGDVGIGTAVPVVASNYGNLSLAGNTGGQLELKRLSNDTRHYIWGNDNLNIAGGYYNGSSSSIRFYVNGSNERLRIDSSGNVNIGPPATPRKRLDITGPDGRSGASSGNSDTALLIDNDGSNGAIIEMMADNNAYGRIFFTDTDASNRGQIVYEHANDAFQFSTAGNERLRIGSLGGHKITCEETYYAANLTECNSGQLAFNINKTRQGQTKGIAFGAIGNSTANTGIQCYDTSDNSANPLLINPFGGNVGIYNNNPKSRLHLGASQDIRIGGQYGGMASMQQQVSYSSGYTGTHWQFKTTDGISWSFDGVLIVHGTGGSSYGSEVVHIKIVYSRESGATNSGDTWRNGSVDYNVETLEHGQVGLNPSSGDLTIDHDSTPGGATGYSLLKLGWSASGQGVGVWSKLIGNFYWGAPSSGDVEIQDKDGNIVFNSNP